MTLARFHFHDVSNHYLPTYLPTYLSTYLPTYLPIYLPRNLPTGEVKLSLRISSVKSRWGFDETTHWLAQHNIQSPCCLADVTFMTLLRFGFAPTANDHHHQSFATRTCRYEKHTFFNLLEGNTVCRGPPDLPTDE